MNCTSTGNFKIIIERIQISQLLQFKLQEIYIRLFPFIFCHILTFFSIFFSLYVVCIETHSASCWNPFFHVSNFITRVARSILRYYAEFKYKKTLKRTSIDKFKRRSAIKVNFRSHLNHLNLHMYFFLWFVRLTYTNRNLEQTTII